MLTVSAGVPTEKQTKHTHSAQTHAHIFKCIKVPITIGWKQCLRLFLRASQKSPILSKLLLSQAKAWELISLSCGIATCRFTCGGHLSPQIAAQSEQMSGMLKSDSLYLYCISQPFNSSFSPCPPLPSLFHFTSKTKVTSLAAAGSQNQPSHNE